MSWKKVSLLVTVSFCLLNCVALGFCLAAFAATLHSNRNARESLQRAKASLHRGQVELEETRRLNREIARRIQELRSGKPSPVIYLPEGDQ